MGIGYKQALEENKEESEIMGAIAMAQHRTKKESQPVKQDSPKPDKGLPADEHLHSSIELNEEVALQGFDINLGGKRMGGHSGGDFDGGGGGPALGEVHAADDSTADHYGSREETNAALEEKIAIQNTRRLHKHF